MTDQAKRLKSLLNRHGIANEYGKLSVRTQITAAGEWAEAVAHVRAITQEEAERLSAADKWICGSVFPHVGGGFSILQSGGRDGIVFYNAREHRGEPSIANTATAADVL